MHIVYSNNKNWIKGSHKFQFESQDNYSNTNFIINPEYVEFNENINRLELESFSSKNSEAKYHKNLQFRDKLPKKNERENSTPSRMNAEHADVKNNTSVEQYRNFINNSQDFNDSYLQLDTEDLVGTSIMITKDYKDKSLKSKMRASSISSSNISLVSESTSSNQLIGWSYQQTRDGKLYNMTQDAEWRQLYKSRYINDRVEAELVEFKDEIEKKFKKSKWKDFKFPRNQKLKEIKTRNDQNMNINAKSQGQSNENNPILLSKNYVFDYNKSGKENQKIRRKNIDFYKKSQNKEPSQPQKMSIMKTIDEETKHKLSKSVPRSNNHSKSRKNKHKRQTTLFKFEQSENSWDRAKYLAKASSSLSVTSQSSWIENITSKNLGNKSTVDDSKMYGNSTNFGGTYTDNTLAQSIASTKPIWKRKIKHNRRISKNSSRGSKGNSQSKTKSRKEKSLSFKMNNLTKSIHQSSWNPNKSQNLESSQIGQAKPSRYNQLIGVWNPNMLYQTQQCLNYKQNKSSGPVSPRNQSKMQVLSNKYLIKKKANDPVCAFKLNSNIRNTSWKKSEKKRRQNSKVSTTSKVKHSSAARSLTKKVTSPYNKSKASKERSGQKISSATQTAREIARTSRKEKSVHGRNMAKKSWFSSSKISSWVEAMNNGTNSEMNSNMYRNNEGSAPSQGRAKSNRSHVSTKKKRKKHYSSISQALENKTFDGSKPKNYTKQLISLIQKIHSPNMLKTSSTESPKQICSSEILKLWTNTKTSHNHSLSEVQSQAVKRIIPAKNRNLSKGSKKVPMHTRSHTSENSQKVKLKINPFRDYSNVFKTLNNDNSIISPNKDMIENDSKLLNKLTLNGKFS